MTEIKEKNPLIVFTQWLEEARREEINDPEAMCLATSTRDGKPSARMVLLKDFGENGFRFHTNSESRKGNEITQNPQACLLFHWKSLRKQVRIDGPVSETTDQEADDYFATRPYARQIGAWASQQSRHLETRESLEKSIEHYGKLFEGQKIPRPPVWKGYRVVPLQIEFWTDNPDRLHDRFLYTKTPEGLWTLSRLYP